MATGTMLLSKLHSEGSVWRKMEPGLHFKTEKKWDVIFEAVSSRKWLQIIWQIQPALEVLYLLLVPVNISALKMTTFRSQLAMAVQIYSLAGNSLVVPSLCVVCVLGRVAKWQALGGGGRDPLSGLRSDRCSTLGCPTSAQVTRAWVPGGKGWTLALPPFFLYNFERSRISPEPIIS